jgi:pimeloyl-ACP methyl ester carboxylesterase
LLARWSRRFDVFKAAPVIQLFFLGGSTIMKKLGIIAANLCILVSLLLAAAPARAMSAGKRLQVETATFNVTLSNSEEHFIRGYLYYRGALAHQPLQLLVHGSTYNSRYWDVPAINGHEYSYAEYMTRRGYAVLSIDKLGTGFSSMPDGDLLTIDEVASSLHGVMQNLRTVQNPFHHKFSRITLVGHSLGSITAIYAQGTYGDADALVVTGQALTPHPLPFDDATINELLSVPYPTMPGEARAAIFYYPPTADPDVIDFDNTLIRDVVPRGELMSALPFLADPSLMRASLITAPVLIQLGEYDLYAPGDLAPSEAAYYSSASSVTVEVLPDIGHDFNLHINNEEGWAQIDAWISGL